MDKEKNISCYIENFLNFIREAKISDNYAKNSLDEKNMQTQDILHSLELLEHNYHETAKIAKILVNVRQERRQYKDIIQKLEPIINWQNNNLKIISNLEHLLGEVRKNEKQILNRHYNPKTDILQEQDIQSLQKGE